MQDGRARIKDVAALAGVSTATVSRALTRPDLVNAATREAVAAAIAATGYRPNHAARNLRHRRTGGILALVPNLANPFFSQILSGIASVLAPAGYSLLVTDTTGEGGRAALDQAEPSRADGLIVLDGGLPAEALARGLPVVTVCEWLPGLEAPRIRIDNAAGAGLAVAHLAGLGHRRIGHVLGPAGNVLTAARLEGTRAALAAHGLPLAGEAVYVGDFGLDSGRAAAGRWLAQPEATRPTALFLQSDAMACGFIGEVLHHGLRVPRDVSVVGFDDIELAAHISPPLTTIRQPRVTLGRVAAARLLARLAGPGDDADTVLPVELVVRASTAPPPLRHPAKPAL